MINIKWKTKPKHFLKFKDIKAGECFTLPEGARERVVFLKTVDSALILESDNFDLCQFEDDEEVVKLKSTLVVEEE